MTEEIEKGLELADKVVPEEKKEGIKAAWDNFLARIPDTLIVKIILGILVLIALYFLFTKIIYPMTTKGIIPLINYLKKSDKNNEKENTNTKETEIKISDNSNAILSGNNITGSNVNIGNVNINNGLSARVDGHTLILENGANSQAEIEHDKRIFNDFLSVFPESNYEDIFYLLTAHRRYEDPQLKFLRDTIDFLSKPKNVFINNDLKNKAKDLYEKIKDLDYELSTHTNIDENNPNLHVFFDYARMQDGYKEKYKLIERINDMTIRVENSFRDFRETAGRTLYV